MARYLMIGKYSTEAVREISAQRTDKAIRLIKELGGEVHSMYALLGGFDFMLLVDFPKLEVAMKASLGLTILTGISFTTYPAVTINDFDKMMGKL